jgi:RNase P subunit RPR2
MSWLKRIFCKHDEKPFTKTSKFQNLSGETIYYVCAKCGKENKNTSFRRYEGNGYK